MLLAVGFIAVKLELDVVYRTLPLVTPTPSVDDGAVLFAKAFDPCTVWLWAGISDMISVTESDPPLTPRGYCPPPEYWSVCMGARLKRFGRPKVDFPSPP